MSMTKIIPNSESAFYARAERRIEWLTISLGGIVSLVLLLGAGWRVGVGFAVGALLSFLNFRWIKEMVDALVRAGRERISRWTYAKIFLRYALLGLTLYAIFARSFLPWKSVLGGLFVLVAAVMLELVVELFEKG